MAASASAAAAPAPPAQPVGQLALTGDVSVHDPTMTFDAASGLYILAATGGSIRTSPAMTGPWKNVGNTPGASWVSQVPNTAALWAPHLKKIGDTFYYYYSQSSFGSNTSAIGVKTTKTPAIPSSYVDLGHAIISSGALATGNPTLDINAIDPDVVQTADGTWWITWGSFRDGIAVQQLGDDHVSVVGQPTLIASRRAADNPVEGPGIFYRDGYYYLQVSWDRCCNAAASTYKIAIGRATSITGPYLDQDGVSMDQGGGTVILDSRQSAAGVTPAGLYRAPGGADVYTEDGVDYLVYHAYLPNNTLGIRPMVWRDGWPSLPDADNGSYDLTNGSYVRLATEANNFVMPPITRVAGPTPAFGNALKLNGGDPVQYVAMPDGILSQLSGDFTISMWVKRGTTVGNDWARLFDFGQDTRSFMFLTAASGGTPTGLRWDTVTTAKASTVPGSGNSAPVSTDWTQVAVSASGTTATLWMNGTAVGTNTNYTLRPADLGKTLNNWIGRSQFAADPGLNGSVDDFNIFSRALTPAQMLDMVTAPGGGSAVGGGDIAWYKFDESGGAEVTDSSGSGKTATAVVPVASADSLQNPVKGTQCLTSGTTGVIQSTCADGDATQTWKLNEAGDGLYRLASNSSYDDACLAVANSSGVAGSALTTAPCGSPQSPNAQSSLQTWSIEDTGQGFLRFSNPATGLAVEIDNDHGAILTNVVGAPRAISPIANMDPPQQWKLEHVQAVNVIETIEAPSKPTFTDSCGVDNNGIVSVRDGDRGAHWAWTVGAPGPDGSFAVQAVADDGYVFASDGTSTPGSWDFKQDNARCDASITATASAQKCTASGGEVPGSLTLDRVGIGSADVYAGSRTGTKAGDLSKLAPGDYLIIATATTGSVFNSVPPGFKPSPITDDSGNVVEVSRVLTIGATACVLPPAAGKGDTAGSTADAGGTSSGPLALTGSGALFAGIGALALLGAGAAAFWLRRRRVQ